jgi:hypothetical protein
VQRRDSSGHYVQKGKLVGLRKTNLTSRGPKTCLFHLRPHELVQMATEQRVAKRKTHTKSRKGCFQCKQRHTKASTLRSHDRVLRLPDSQSIGYWAPFLSPESPRLIRDALHIYSKAMTPCSDLASSYAD